MCGAIDVQFCVPRDYIDAARSPAFLLYLRGLFSDLSCGFTHGNSISVLWKGYNLSVNVFSLNGHKELKDNSSICDDNDEVFYPLRYVITRETTVTFCILEESYPEQEMKFSMTDALMEEDEDEDEEGAFTTILTTLPTETVERAGDTPIVLPYFGGYSSCVQEAWKLMLRGLELTIDSNNNNYNNGSNNNNTVFAAISKPPRGLLLYGSRGTGKSTLMRRLAKAANVAVEEISHSIVLSRLVL